MRSVSVAVVLLLLSVCTGALSVHVQVEGQVFPLEAVQELKELLDMNDLNPASVCEHALLPQAFHPACQQEGADILFTKLMNIMVSSDPCEICANPSCFGCLK